MKRTLITLFAVAMATYAVGQTTRIANNNPGATPGVNVYTGSTALQSAINASVSGDIIHIVAGTISNGDVTITDKSLTILGVGLNPQKGLGTRSLVGNITINGSASSGSRISGIHMARMFLVTNASTPHVLANLLIENCQLNSIQEGNNANSIGNMIVRNCVINSHASSTAVPQAFELYSTSGVVITNNIIRAQGSTAGTVSGTGLTVQNNLFYSTTGSLYYVFTFLVNSIVQNNIFLRISGATGPIASCTGNTFYNNIGFGANDNTFTNGTGGNSSSGGINADPMLTNVPSVATDWLYTYNITPLTGSPAINAGLDGTNIGPTGGSIPFDTEGTLLPLIEAINMPAIVTKGVPLQVNVKARGN